MCWDIIIETLRDPKKAFSKEKKTTVHDSFNRLCILGVVYAFMGMLVEGIFRGWNGMLLIESFIFLYLFAVIGVYLFGVWLHFWALIFGTKKRLVDTVKVTSIGATPYLLLGWIPFIGPLTMIWTVYLEYMGLKIIHGMEPSRALLTMIVKVVATIVLCMAVVMTFFTILFLAGAPIGMMY